ncbi:MAG: hypothetical protein J6S97_10300 [Bacteroidales bacterium]|nr:hypothetical protein [Bacteroidales bacterium]MBP5382167.1 hypothetical protein [Bacteroidales bacterium]MBP5522304.1 hypothetical protein [Bacteroidales bacterium]
MNTILKLSPLYDDESWSIPGARTIDLRGLDGCCCYCDSAAEERIKSEIAGTGTAGIHWIDTGDYHYITKFWLERLSEPFLLSLFDNHPDDGQDSLGGGLLSCGNWVAACRDSLPLMKGCCRNTASLPGSLPVYLSIDLDVLSPQWARTDWSQGEMSLPELLQAIDSITKEHRVLGIDICGGLTLSKGARPSDLSINVRTRMLLADYFSSHPLVSG